MTAFPGFIFDGEGRPLDNRATDLTQDEIDAAVHRSAVQTEIGPASQDGVSPIALVWLLNDDAAFAAIPSAIIAATIDTAMKGCSILILASRSEVGAEIRDGLLEALEIAQAPAEVAGFA